MDFKITGGKELQAALKQLPAKFQKRIEKNALRAGARVIAKEAKTRVPVDTGALKKSIRVVTGKTREGARVYVTAGAGGKHDAFYAHMVEFGTKAHFTQKGGATKVGQFALTKAEAGRHPGSRPQPFMRPAIDLKGEEAIAQVGITIAANIEKLGK